MKVFLRKLFGQRILNYYHLGQAFLANLFYGFPSRRLTVIGVTGTDGKTTTVNLTAQILRRAGFTTALLSTVSAQIGGQTFDTGFHTTTPSPFLLQKFLRQMVLAGAQFAVLEVTSHALDQNRVWGIKFDTAVLTNLTPEHLDYHQTFEEYERAKTRIFSGAKHRVVNHNSPTLPLILKGGVGELLTFGLSSTADIWAHNIKEDLTSTAFQVHIRDSKFEVSLNMPGNFNVLNALAALAVGQIYNVSHEAIIKGLAEAEGVPGRMEFIEEGQDFKVLVDFAHTENALRNLLEFLRSKILGRIILVFGAAGERDRLKRPKMGQVADELADLVIITREDNRSEDVLAIAQAIAGGTSRKKFNQDYFIIPDRRSAVRSALAQARPGDLVALTGKGHEQSLNIDGIETVWDDRKVAREELKKIRTAGNS